MTALSHEEAKALFQPRVDAELETLDDRALGQHLDSCQDCQSEWREYESVVRDLRTLPKAPAPELASQILKRLRRRRPLLRALQYSWNHRVPVEGIVIVLIAAALFCWFLVAG